MLIRVVINVSDREEGGEKFCLCVVCCVQQQCSTCECNSLDIEILASNNRIEKKQESSKISARQYVAE